MILKKELQKNFQVGEILKIMKIILETMNGFQ